MQQVKRVPLQAKAQVERVRSRFAPLDVLMRTFKRYSKDDVGTHAAALTYYAFFSIFPLLLFGAAMVGYLTLGNEALRKEIIEHAINGIPVVRDALGIETLKRIEENRQTLALTGLVLALYSGSGAIVALEHALNRISHVRIEPKFLAKRIRSLKWLALLGVAALGSIALGAVARFVPSALTSAAAILTGIVINFFVFATAFKFLPAHDRSWRDVLPGAFFTAVAFELLKNFGATYLARGEAARSATFGTLAGAATLLVASYLLSQVVLLAAELNAVLIERRETRRRLATEEEP